MMILITPALDGCERSIAMEVGSRLAAQVVGVVAVAIEPSSDCGGYTHRAPLFITNGLEIRH